ncbi:Dbl homology domain-containing protein [Dendrothele bispora CBS 962.96]|uniref:Dbl homology domain-containing protein n=1 Tax=Dendrothele bispora (strain CBS 962.96) TaxID=1314807 RepID=A0A4S8LCI8_DENBC|nr:Dbl homology domain-containing protein [Dendrothele bispora CBS 962.96]
MKAFFSRLHLGSAKDKEKVHPSPSYSSLKPLPDITEDQPLQPPSPSPTPPATSTPNPSGDPAVQQKKVAFASPPPTPIQPVITRSLPDDAPVSLPPPLKTSVSRFQDAHGKEPRGSTSSTGASSSKTNLAASSSKASVKATSTRATSPYLHKQDAVSAQSLRSGTPYSQMSNNTSGSRILAATSWSEVTEEDLVTNLGSRERTRQEVLFEIISSEERYVGELAKMKETFIDPLLHPFSSTPASPTASTPNLDYDYYRSESPVESADQLPPIAARFMSPTPSLRPPNKDANNIDAESMDTDDDDDTYQGPTKRFGSPKPGASSSQASKHNHPRSPYRSTAANRNVGKNGTSVPFPSRSHHSLPPPPRSQQLNASTMSLGRQSIIVERERERNYSQGQASMAERRSESKPGMLRKFNRKNDTKNILGDSVAPHQLPEDLRICLQVIDSGVFDGHKRLSEALRKRYEDQFPLVRSLADVFVSNSDIFQGYAKYVLHLERALEQVDNALSNTSTKKPKNQDMAEWQKVCKAIQRLEETASEKGETGLAISLSKPFQRLLKYPLLFQNLLFHTDPSTFEYESTLQMVAEVETIVRSIEDEKIQKEERDKTRDVFARIDGIDRVRQIAAPKPSRVLVEEKQYNPGPSSPSSGLSKSATPPSALNGKGVKGKSSFRRLSDVLGKKDLWLVVFNDVVLLCQKTGTTSLPLVAATNSRTNSLPELQGRSKYATTGRRNSHTKPRNLYKFIKVMEIDLFICRIRIETWAINQPQQSVVTKEDVARSRTQLSTQPRIVPLPDDDEGDADDADSDDSDRKSKMSFSYWGADKITVQRPTVKPRNGVAAKRAGASGPAYARESSANAKFGTRLVSGESTPSPRPASRRTATTPNTRRNGLSEDSHNYAKATVTKPEWNTSTRTPTATPISKRSRNTSQTSAMARTITNSSSNAATAKQLSSPAPSEDSGVGLYRQMMAHDPNLNHV